MIFLPDKKTRYIIIFAFLTFAIFFSFPRAASAGSDGSVFFEVDIIDWDEEVIEGQDLEVNAEIHNVGENEGVQDVELLDIYGDVADFNEVTLDNGESENIVLVWETESGDAGTGDISVRSENDEDSVEVTVLGESSFEISRWKVDPDVVEPGEFVGVDVEVKNTGDVSDEFTLDLFVDGKLEDWETRGLGAGESTRVDFSVSRDDVGKYGVVVSTGDDEESGSFEVVEEKPEFKIERWKVDPDEVEPGKELEISSEVKNIGDVSGDFTLELYIDNKLEDWETGTLSSDNSVRLDFTVSREEEGEYDVLISTGDDYRKGNFKVREVKPPLDIRIPDDYDYREWIFDGETFKTEVEIHNQRDEELEGVRVVGDNIRGYGIGVLEPDEVKTLEIRIPPDNYQAGEINEFSLRAEHEHGNSPPKKIKFRVLSEESPVEAFLASTNSPIYEGEKMKFTIVVAAAADSGVKDLVVRSLSENVVPTGYWVGEEMKEVGEDPDQTTDLSPFMADGSEFDFMDRNKDNDRMVVGRKLYFEHENPETGEEELDFEITYELGDRSVRKEFEVGYRVRESDPISLIKSEPVRGEAGETLSVSLEIANEKDIRVKGVKIIPPEGVDISPSPSYWVGSMDPDEFLPVEFRLDSEDVEDGETLNFHPEYRVGERRFSGPPLEVTVNIAEREETPVAYYAVIVVVIAAAVLLVYWRKR